MKRVITYGTFDLFHKGHYNILKRAKEAGDYLIVGVTGERYDAERGKLSVKDSLATRIENVKATGFADEIIVEEYLGQKISDIIKYNIDVLVIGSDWRGKFDHLNKYCEVRYLERTKNISSTQIRGEMLTYKYGIVTDNLYDKENVTEPKHVSGIHVESVFAEQKEIADKFCEKYELDKGFSDYDEFLKSVDIVYIKVKRNDRIHYVEKALQAGKHVICDSPYAMNKEQEKRMNEIAQEKGTILVSNSTICYLQAFGQLLWMARGNSIGDLLSVRCSISRKSFSEENNMDFYDLAYYPLCTIVKIMGSDFKSHNRKIVKDESGNISYGVFNIIYENAIATAEIGINTEVSDEMRITGTNGSITVPEDWWHMGYFKMKRSGEKKYSRYCSNYEGNGFRYLIQAVLEMIRTKKISSQRITEDEKFAISDILNS